MDLNEVVNIALDDKVLQECRLGSKKKQIFEL